MSPAEFKEWAEAILPTAYAIVMLCIAAALVWFAIRREDR